MKLSVGVLLRGAVWTISGFGAGQVVRLITNILLTRLLAPQLFGLMVIVNTIRMGIELVSDLGIGQNIIYSQNAHKPDFYNTAWTLQFFRSLLLWALIIMATLPLAQFYNLPVLKLLLPITGVITILGGITSISPQLLQKNLQFAKLNSFQFIVDACSSAIHIALACLSPTIWALVFGGVLGSAVTMIGSYFLLPEIKLRFQIDKGSFREIVDFGKWITLGAIVYFFSINFDRLYFAKVVPLELLGVYGIARSMSDLLGALAARLGSGVVFPFVASHLNTPRAHLRSELASIRGRFLLLAAVGCSLLIAAADLAIGILYDARYQAAGWMLPIMIVGSWFSIVAGLNESTLLGLGRPSYQAISNSLKFVLLFFGLPFSFRTTGLVGAVLALALIEASRYIPVLIGQVRQRFSYGMQDLLATVAMFLMVALWEWVRWAAGFGTSFDSLPIKELM
jgi:O-antigen/teichoic acid export membrane protein